MIYLGRNRSSQDRQQGKYRGEYGKEWYYLRAHATAGGMPDLMPNMSQLIQKPDDWKNSTCLYKRIFLTDQMAVF
jgi:hypothetical protein